MKKIFFIMVIAGLIVLLNVFCNKNPLSNDNTLDNSNSIVYTAKDEEATDSVNNLPDFDIKLPASLEANGVTSAHSRIVFTDYTNSGLKSFGWQRFRGFISDSQMTKIQRFIHRLKIYTAGHKIKIGKTLALSTTKSVKCLTNSGVFNFYLTVDNTADTNFPVKAYAKLAIQPDTDVKVYTKLIFGTGGTDGTGFIYSEYTKASNQIVSAFKIDNGTNHRKSIEKIVKGDDVKVFFHHNINTNSRIIDTVAYGSSNYGGFIHSNVSSSNVVFKDFYDSRGDLIKTIHTVAATTNISFSLKHIRPKTGYTLNHNTLKTVMWVENDGNDSYDSGTDILLDARRVLYSMNILNTDETAVPVTYNNYLINVNSPNVLTNYSLVLDSSNSKSAMLSVNSNLAEINTASFKPAYTDFQTDITEVSNMSLDDFPNL